MSHERSRWLTVKLYIHVIVWGSGIGVAGAWLTIFLIGTLRDPFATANRQNRFGIGSEDAAGILALTEKKIDRYLGEWQFSEPTLPGHFHHIGKWYETDDWSFCIDCHGPLPHARNPQTRSFLNMHNLYVACRTCHVREKKGVAPTRFGWVRVADGEITTRLRMQSGVWGEYGSKIVPLEPDADRRVWSLEKEETFAETFRNQMYVMTSEQRGIGNKYLHRSCTENPVRCVECHNGKKPYLPYEDLGYTAKRTSFLVSAEVVDLVQRYEEFHIPGMLAPGENGARTEEESGQ